MYHTNQPADWMRQYDYSSRDGHSAAWFTLLACPSNTTAEMCVSNWGKERLVDHDGGKRKRENCISLGLLRTLTLCPSELKLPDKPFHNFGSSKFVARRS